jgi:mannose-6-phosphate isomerase-like protein (cupin superfamily)
MQALNLSDPGRIAENLRERYHNVLIGNTNDHVVRLSVMSEPFYWHRHPNSDETFLVLEGILVIDFRDQSMELSPGQLLTVPRNVEHRTRPLGTRSVNITFESANLETIKSEE